MSHIKLFEEYNSRFEDIKEMIQEITDITMELRDEGYDVEITNWTLTDKLEKPGIVVSIYGKELDWSKIGYHGDETEHEEFKSSIFKDFDIRIKDYLGDKLKSSHYKYDADYSPAMIRVEDFPSVTTNELICIYEIY